MRLSEQRTELAQVISNVSMLFKNAIVGTRHAVSVLRRDSGQGMPWPYSMLKALRARACYYNLKFLKF